MPTVEPRRSVQVGIGSRTKRGVGPAPAFTDDASLSEQPAWAGALGGRALPLTTSDNPPPSGLWIPGYNGPDVGLTNPSILTPYTGPTTITSTQTIENKIFTGIMIAQDGATVTARNCWHKGGHPDYFFKTFTGGTWIVEDSQVGDPTPPSQTQHGFSGSFKVYRTKVWYLEDGFKGSGGSIMEQNHCYLLRSPSSAPHHDCMQESSSGPATIRYNNFDCRRADGVPSGLTAAVFIKTDFGNINGSIVENNLLNGGAYTMYLQNANGFQVTNTIVRNNVFGHDAVFGKVRIDPGTYAVWSNNVDVDGNPVNP